MVLNKYYLFTETEQNKLPCERSACKITFLLSKTPEKAGQPQPESNLDSEENISVEHTIQQYFPSSFNLRYSPEKALQKNARFSLIL